MLIFFYYKQQQMEELPFQESLLANSKPKINQQTLQIHKQHITSLPELQLNKLDLQEPISFIKTFSEIEDCLNKSISQIKGQEIPSKDRIYKKVFTFIQDINNIPHKFDQLLGAFQRIEMELKKTSYKSIKIVRTNKNIAKKIKSMKNQKLMSMKENPKRYQKIVKFQQYQPQNISIKLINSKHNVFISKSKQVSFKDNASLSNFAVQKGKPPILDKIENSDDIQARLQAQQQSKNLSKQQLTFEKLSDINDIKSSHSSEDEKGNLLFKKISIAMFDSIIDPDEIAEKQSVIFSSQEYLSIKDVFLPNLTFTQDLIASIFDNCSPFLINLSLCLLVKFLLKSKYKLSLNNICWLLGISTIVAYKIFYDQTIQNLLEYYSQILEIGQKNLIFLQRWFLQGLNYQVVISNMHYHDMLTRLVKQKD